MERLGRLIKNPLRVPLVLQREDPGVTAGPSHVIDVITEGEKAKMPKLSKSGIYEDREGNRFYYTEGTPVTDAQREDLTYVGARDRGERERSLPAPAQNRMDAPPHTPEGVQVPPDNRGLQTPSVPPEPTPPPVPPVPTTPPVPPVEGDAPKDLAGDAGSNG